MKMAEVASEPVGISTHNAKDVGIAFVREYYTTAVTNVNGVFNMFGDDSVYVGDSGDEHFGQHDIRAAIAGLNLHGGKVRIFSVGTAPVGSGGIIIQVFAAYVGNSSESRFTETFFLSQQKLAKYYVRSTIFKWIDQPPVLVAIPLDYGVNGHQRVTIENNAANHSHNDSLPDPNAQDEAQQETLIYQSQPGAVNQTQTEAQVQNVEPPSPTEQQPEAAAAPIVNGNGTSQHRRNSRGRRHRGTPSPKDKDGRNGRKNQPKADENTAPEANGTAARDHGVANVNGNIHNGFNGAVYTNGNIVEHQEAQVTNGVNKKPLGNRIENKTGPRPVKPNTTVHVAGIEKHKQAEHDDVAADLKKIFSAYGEVIRVNVPLRCFSDEFHNAFAFVEFATREGVESILSSRPMDNRGRIVLNVDIPALGHSGDISVAENRERSRFNGPPNSAQVRNARHYPDNRNGNKGNNNGVPQKPWKAVY